MNNLENKVTSHRKLRGANLREVDLMYAKFYGKGGSTKIDKNQLDDFLKALGVVVED